MLKKIFLACLLLLALGLGQAFGAKEATLSDIETLFKARKWGELDKLVKQNNNLSPQERSIAANAYRLQGRWADVVEMFGGLNGFPESIVPYAKMTLAIALENSDRKDEALSITEELRKNPPAGLGYYVAYASYRLTDDAELRKKALKEMASRADQKTQKAYTLEQLLKAGENKTENAKKLLGLDPSNSLAVKVLSELTKPWSAENGLLLGYAAYLSKDNKRAAEILSIAPNSRKAQYYRAFALYNDKKYDSALKLWSKLAMSGNSYSLSSANRISILSNRKEAPQDVRTQAVEVLKRIAETRKGTIQARALYSLGLYDRVLTEYPSTSFSLKVVWERGMKAWDAGNFKEALWYWQRANMPDISTSWGARVLYWIAKAQQKLGQKNDAEKTLKSLVSRYPFSIYSYMAKPGAIEIVDTEPFSANVLELEDWGFMSYAKMLLLRDAKNAKSAYRAAKISEWIGDDGSVYSAGLSLQKFFVKGTKASRQGMQLVYPRPYSGSVRKAAERFGVEDNLVWSIMKQESAFNPLAKSHVGASGLMQLMPGTAKGEAGLLKMKDFKVWDVGDNITLGTSYISRQLRSFGNPQRAAAAYNAGPGNARKWNNGGENLPLDLWIERITFDETCDYVQRVMGNLMTYRLLYGEKNSPVTALEHTPPDDEEIEAKRAAEFSGSIDDTISTPKEP